MGEDKDLDFERKHQEDLQRLRGFRLLDDDFMTKVFEDEDCVGFLLKIILNRDDLTVKRSNSQYTVKNLQGRSVRLDILAVDRENRVRIACLMLEDGALSYNKIAAFTELTVKEVQELDDKRSA